MRNVHSRGSGDMGRAGTQKKGCAFRSTRPSVMGQTLVNNCERRLIRGCGRALIRLVANQIVEIVPAVGEHVQQAA